MFGGQCKGLSHVRDAYKHFDKLLQGTCHHLEGESPSHSAIYYIYIYKRQPLHLSATMSVEE